MPSIIPPIGNNTIKMGSGQPSFGKQTVLFGAQQVIVGAPPAGGYQSVSRYNPDTGLYEEASAGEAKTIYNLNTQIKHNCLIVRLETGGRGWFPGAKTYGNAVSGTELKASEDETSATLYTFNITTLVRILSKLDGTNIARWYNITFTIDGNTYIGYVKTENISGIHYRSN